MPVHRSRIYLAAMLAAALSTAGAVERVILDTDLGDDVDDAGTLAVMHALADRGEIEILAVGIVNGHVDSVPCADAINTWYGRPNLPLGTIKSGAPINHDRFRMGAIAAAYPHDLTQASAPDIIGLYRSILARQPDRSVTLVVVGQATNVMNLLKSQPDAHSPLDGVALMRQKIKFYAAGGNGRATLPYGDAGWNYQNDRTAAAYELTYLPVEFPTVFAGGSGLTILVGSCYQSAPADHIIRVAYEYYFGGIAKDRPTWDQVRMLYGSRPAIRSMFTRSADGNITLDVSTGILAWTATPNRNRSYAYVNDKPAMAAELTALMMHMPASTPTAIASPAAGATVSPGSVVTVTGTGSDLRWSIDVIEDGQPAFASGAGASFSFTVPATATSAQKIRVTLQGSNGVQVRDYAVAASSSSLLRINFQPATAAVPAGYLVDAGAAFADRGNGASYGWLGGSNDQTRDRGHHADQRYDTFNHMQNLGVDRVWELALAPGPYQVRLAMGDPRYADQTNSVFIEGQRQGDPDGVDLIDEYTATVTVGDGRLTIRPDANQLVGAKIMFIEVTPQQSPVQTGSIVREYWSNVAGTAVSAIPVTTPPTGTAILTSLEGPTNWGDSYGTRIRGYLVPPSTGAYTLWIAGDDDCQLWLSTGADPAQRRLVASVVGWTGSRVWDKYPSQRSAAVSLVAGQRYYIEVLHKEGTGGDNVAVGWSLPGASTTAPSAVVPGSALARYEAAASAPSLDVTALVLRGVVSGGSVTVDGQAVAVGTTGAWEATIQLPGEAQRTVEVVAQGPGGTTIRAVGIDEAVAPTAID